MAEIRLGLHSVSKLRAEHLAQFVCSREELRAFLLEDAIDYSRQRLTETAVAFINDDPIPAGYFSLSADGLPLADPEKVDLGLPFECSITYFPAVKITKLAVRTDLQRQGLGKAFLNLIEGLAYDSDFSVRLLTVDAVNEPDVIGFYQSLGFRTANRNEARLRQHQEQQRRAGKARAKPQGDANADGKLATVLMYKDIHSEDPPVRLTVPVPTTEPPQIT